MRGEPPFSAPSYELPSGSLNPLNNRNDAITIGELLAKINPWITLGFTSNHFMNYFTRRDPGLNRYLVVQNGHKIGTVCVRYPWLRGAYIELIGLAEPYQGRGLGRQIIHWVVDQTRQESRNLWVAVSEFNPRAMSFYERQGFRVAALLPDLVKPGFDEILMRKTLK
ncbi:MAG: GNAT family N-acetyltransferase [Deltaproteobacteria bacterium]|nr:GNAT family N-acetyltransferase [Deltaproteobacteria bacterium]